MKKALLINGSPHKEGCTYTALCEIQKTLLKNDVESEILYLGIKGIPGCTGCGKCRETGECVFSDIVNETAARLDEFSAIVVGSPVHFASPSGQILPFLDRLFYSGRGFEGKVGASIVSCRRGGATASFDVLNKYFAIRSMPIASSQYWNMVHGNTPSEVLRDEEGMQTMRTLAENIAWLMKCIDFGTQNGLEIPKHEKPIKTNFIR